MNKLTFVQGKLFANFEHTGQCAGPVRPDITHSKLRITICDVNLRFISGPLSIRAAPRESVYECDSQACEHIVIILSDHLDGLDSRLSILDSSRRSSQCTYDL